MLSKPRVQHYLKNFELEKLFIEELGWDRHHNSLDVSIEGHTYKLQGIAEKRGVQILRCLPDDDGKIPGYHTRQKIERHITKLAYEHLIVFVDGAWTTQIWQWVARQPGQSAAYREHTYDVTTHSGDALIQKLEQITIPLDEEEALDLTGTVHKLRDAFDRDRVTQRFYKHFERKHVEFLSFVKGIRKQGDKEWYASLMLNRLIFVYFIQKKRFLDRNANYLQDRLQKVQNLKGKNKFISFYRYFLLCLFHEGFAKQPEHRDLDPDLKELIGDVPYLNGGLFEAHELEDKYPKVDIPDEAFERVFAFFDQYDWHLDTRPLRKDHEINPDVLGYIFEKYINQKQMGAYYTKEDITDYISKNTIIPRLFDTATKKCAVAFEPGSAMWRLLQDAPDRYIYPAVRKGIIDKDGQVIPLPKEILKGIEDVSKRGNWNQPADAQYALPTETWREHVARRERCLEIRETLRLGDIHRINDLITYNLDIRQFVEDAIATCEGPELLRAFYQAIASVTVLDPACGSGAFLFAALNILEPLYEACLERMRLFVEELERSGESYHARKFSDFRRVLNEAHDHPNRSYFIFKSIIVNNLYGVDIMVEAVEICKLRLFLKLVAQVDKAKDLEPLPDIDFNIRPGNTLVGFARLDDVKKTLDGTLGLGKKHVGNIVEQAEIVERAFQKFRQMQIEYDMDALEFTEQKRELRQRLHILTAELDRYLAREYDVDPDNTNKYEKWRVSHQPFHWFAEFYGIMHDGGFDVIIGNPPYVVYSIPKVLYGIESMNYRTLPCKNLYAFMFERSIQLARPKAPVSLIVQLTVLSSSKVKVLQNMLVSRGSLYVLPFPRRPESMFAGVEMPVAILISMGQESSEYVSSRVGRLYTEERPTTLDTIQLVSHQIRIHDHRVAKIGTSIEKQIFEKIALHNGTLDSLTVNKSKHVVYYQEACRYWLKAHLGLPYFKRNNQNIRPPHGRFLYLKTPENADFVGCLLNSSFFYWYYSVFSDCEHVNDRLVRDIPIPIDWNKTSWQPISQNLLKSLQINSTRKIINTKQGHKVEYNEIKAILSKNIIDLIDSSLCKSYGLSDFETDFIINYDAKYRSGIETNHEL